MAKSNKSVAAVATVATPAQDAPQVVQATTPAPTVVALRGGAAVALVTVVAGAVYRTKAPHNQAWWATVTAQATGKAAPVAELVAAPHSVPTHFIGYCIRRGYLAAA